MSKKVFAHWFMFPGLSRYLGRDRLSGDGSGARTVKRLVTTRWPARASL